MTAQSSAVKPAVFAKFGAYFACKLKFLRPNIIMNGILALLSYPLAFGLLIPLSAACEKYYELADQGIDIYMDSWAFTARNTMNQWNDIAVTGMVIGAICLVLLFVFTLVTTVRGFRYLYDKTYVDMDYSLPINGNTRFCADTLAVLSATIVPHILSIMIGIILINFINFDALFSAEEYTWLITQYMFTGLFSCVMLVGLTMMMLSFCGKKAEAYIYPVLINIAIPFIHTLCVYIVQNNTYGATWDYSFRSVLQIGVTSPVGMVLASFIPVLNAMVPDALPVFTPEYGISALVFTLIFFAAAYFLIKYRRNERVGSPYVYNSMTYIIPGVIIFAVALPICEQIFDSLKDGESPAGWLIGLVISTFVLYVIMELISGKNFRKFHITVAKWAATVAVSAGITSVLFFSNGFGAAYYVPDVGEVARASANIYGRYPNVSNSNYHIQETDDEDVIRIITDIHSDIPKEAVDTDENSGCFVNIEYILKNGSSVSRLYWVSREQYAEFIERAVTPKTFYDNTVNNLLYEQADGCDEIGAVTAYSSSRQSVTDTSGLTVDEFLGAVEKDSEKVTSDLLYSAAGEYEMYIYLSLSRKNGGSSQIGLQIYSWMDNTLSLLRRYGADIGGGIDVSEYKAAYIVKFDGTNGYNYYVDDIIALCDGVTEQSVDDPEYYGGDKYVYTVTDWYSFGKADITDSRIAELEKGACAVSPFTTETAYLLILTKADGYYGFIGGNKEYVERWISEEYYDLAEEVYRDYLLPESAVNTPQAL